LRSHLATLLVAPRQALRKSARILKADAEGLADILTREQGKPLSKARDEIGWDAGFLELIAEQKIAVETLRDDAKERIELLRKALPPGVVNIVSGGNELGGIR
jgi:acyl-CoA reductase-like NAD-dependent aldehyde dehydrogenase